MLILHIKCIHCKYEAEIPIGKWTTLCPLCHQHGVYKVETKARPPRIGTDNGKDNNSKS